MATRWLILALLFAARTVMGFQFQSIASVGPHLVADLGVDYATLGTLIGLYLLPGVVVAVPSGVLGKRWGDARMVVSGLALMIVGGLVIGFGQGPATAMLGRVLCGVGAVVLNVLLAKMVADWFAGKEIIMAMAILVNSWPFGIAIGLVTQGWIADTYGWPVVMHFTAGVSAGALLLIAFLYRTPEGTELDATAEVLTQSRLTSREIALVSVAGLIWSLFNVALVGVVGFAPTLLQARGMSPTEAGFLVSIGTWLGIATIPAGGYIAERLQMPNATMVACFVIASAATAWIALGGAPLAAFAVFGVFAWAPAGPIMALATEAMRPINRGPGMGIFFTWYYAGMGILPAIAGVTADLTGSVAAPLYFSAAVMVSCVGILAVFRTLRASLPIPMA